MITTLIRFISKFPIEHSKKVIWLSLLITFFSVAFLPRLYVSTDRNLLAGKDSKEFKRREEVSKMFGTSLVSVVVISADTMQKAKDASDTLAGKLKNHPEFIKEVFYKADLNFFEKHAFMFAPLSTVNNIQSTLNSGKIDFEVLEDSTDLSELILKSADFLSNQPAPKDVDRDKEKEGFNFIGNVLDDVSNWFKDDNVKQLSVINSMLSRASPLQGKGDPSGYLTDKDGKSPSLIIMFIQPASNSGAMEKVAPLTDFIRKKAKETEKKLSGVKTYVSGMPSLQTDELRLVSRDCLVSGFAAGIGVLLIFLIAFRSFRVTIFLVLPLGVGLIWAAGFTGAVYGHLTMITSYFAAVLFGLGVAFTIHIVARFHEALIDGNDKLQAIEIAMTGAGPGVFVGGTTTALAFLAIVFSEFKGFAEMGVISGVGVTLILIANLTLLPAALVLWHPGISAVVVKKRTGRFWDIISRSKFVVPGIIIILFLTGFAFINKINFNYAVESMLPGNSDAVKAIKIMNERTNFSSMYSVSVASSLKNAKKMALKFETLSTVARADAVSDFVPEEQDAKIKTLKSINKDVETRFKKLAALFSQKVKDKNTLTANSLGTSFEELADVFEDLSFDAKRAGRREAKPLALLAEKARKTSDIIKKGSDKRAKELQSLVFGLISRGLNVLVFGFNDKGFSAQDLPDNIKKRFVSADNRHFAVFIYPAGDIGNKEFFYKHVSELQSVDPGVTGHVVTHKRFTKMVHRGFKQAVLWSLLAVVLLVIIDLKTVKGVLMALGPVVLAAGLTALVMELTGFMLNYANLMALPILIGTGVDYGVHMAHRMQQSGDIVVAAKTTGRAIALSGVTTLIGFGSLLLGNHWGVKSLGLLLVIGIFFALLVSLVVLPGIMRSNKKSESAK